jgi:hypothetical protein
VKLDRWGDGDDVTAEAKMSHEHAVRVEHSGMERAGSW